VSGWGELIKRRREQLQLTIEAAARTAGISAESWRRYEAGSGIRLDKIGGVVKALKVRSLEDLARQGDRPLADYEREAIENWSGSGRLTPRQAVALSTTIVGFTDTFINPWLDGESPFALDDMPPFEDFDKRVMMLVAENRAWVAKAAERCLAVGQDIPKGILPFDRPGCYFDEVIMASAIVGAADMLADQPDFFDNIPPSPAVETDDDYVPGDDDWEHVSDMFDDEAFWDDWEVPSLNDHVLLRHILETRHPFTWFDPEAVGESMNASSRAVIGKQTGLAGDELDREINRRANSLAAEMLISTGLTMPTDTMVACGVAYTCWREPIEPEHRHVSDAEMAYMSIATTQVVLPFCTTTAIDWESVTLALLDPTRQVLPARSAAAIFGEDWLEVAKAVTAQLELQVVPIQAAITASLYCQRWWGMPNYERQVKDLMASGVVTAWEDDRDQLADALLHDPLSVPLDVWEQIALGGGFGWNDRWDHRDEPF
jgi:transcriptional regulator with XRE-family HTH domain